MPTIALNNLKTHPAQMRTTHDLEALATLTLQIYERGLHDWQPIVAAPNGDESYHIVSGHRRHMARLLALALADWAREHADREIDIEVVRTMLATLVDSLGSLEQVIDSLLVKYGQEEIPFVLFEGSQKAEILALQAANYGGEQPDVLGVAHSFRQALEAGAMEEEIGRNCGQSVHTVRNHLALTQVPPELAARIAAGELPMSVARTVAELPEPKRSGLAIFILANPSTGSGQAAGKVTARAIKECAAALKKWPGLQQPLLPKHQSQRNIARALVRLWGQVARAYPEDAFAAAAMLIYRGLHEAPWAAPEKLSLWFQALGGDTYFADGRIHWQNVVDYLLPEVGCQSCPLAELPQETLRADLSQGQGGPLGMPCRVGPAPATAGGTKRCLHGLAPDDAFDVRVPWAWSGHPGVVSEGGDYRVKSYEELLAAWQVQADKEQAEDKAAEEAAAQEEAAEAAVTGEQSAENAASQGAAQPAAASPTPPAKDSPIVKQRSQIADFMKRHEQFAANHPFATPCGRCRHRLEGSPTKDESVPHCAWAGRLRRVSFRLLEAADGTGAAAGDSLPRIPVCRQFAPNQPWSELIPAHPQPPEAPRAWLKAQILLLAKAAGRYGSERQSFEFLTGRPMSLSENYSDWFAKQLEEQIGELSPAQLFTLFIWAHAEWQRAKGPRFELPVDGNSMQFGTYRERAWTAAVKKPAEEAAPAIGEGHE